MKSPVWFLFLVYIYHYCLVVAQQSLRNISSRFPSVPHSLIPSHVVSHPDFHTIHRFFDSSPISPSNRYIATTTFSAFASSSMVYATVSIVDVQDGTTKVVDRTAAWDSQVGAQVQWGSTDNELFYNSVCQSEQAPHNVLSATQSSGQLMVRGTMYHRTSRQVKLLDCPIYHISPDGKFGIAPNMLKIHHTQKGYGIRPLDSVGSSTKNFHATPDDGLYLTNTASGHCSLLVSLHQLATVAGIDTTSTPIYGFHSKFSSDGALVMFVVRTLERPVAPRTSSVRVQHLFVLDRGAVSIRRMISWASYPFRPKTCAAHSTNTSSTTAQECPEVLLLDGNHPNWVPNSHLISMNLQKEKTIEGKVSTTAKLLQGAAKWAGLHARKREGEWNIVSIDVDAHPEDFIYRYDTDVNVMDDRILSCSRGERTCASTTEAPLPSPQAPVPQNSVLTVQIGSRAGSGHPIYHPSGKFIITDAYPKEMHALVGSEDMVVLNQSALSPLSVPLRLIEVATQREVWLLQVSNSLLLLIYYFFNEVFSV